MDAVGSPLYEMIQLSSVITSHRYSYASEFQLHSSILALLESKGYIADAEVVLGEHGRIDMLVDGIGIEVKVKGTAVAAIRQLQRYAHSGLIDGLILVTTVYTNRAIYPEHIGGKPLILVDVSANL